MSDFERMMKNKRLFAERITNDFIGLISGRDVTRLVHKDPDETFLIGKLSPFNSNTNITSRTDVRNLSVDFFIKKSDINSARLIIKPFGDFYYRVLPSLEEQMLEILKSLNIGAENKITSYEDLKSYLDKNPEAIVSLRKTQLALVYEKISLDNEKYNIEVKLADIFDKTDEFGKISFKSKLDKELSKDIDKIMNKPNIYRVIRDYPDLEDIASETNYNDFLIRNSNKDIPRPPWSVDIQVNAKLITSDKYRVTVELINDTSGEFKQIKKHKYFSTTLFNSGLEIKLIDGEFQKIELKYFENNYKYDRYQKAIGNRCSVEYDEENNIIRTQTVSLYKQYRLKTKETCSAKFDDLIKKPVDTLNNIYREMLNEKKNWEQYLKNELSKDFTDKNVLTKVQTAFQKEIDNFELEIKRFKYGIEQIELYDSVKQSFIAMNKTFKKNTKYNSWRLFQIVFIVSLIPDIIVSEYGEEVIEMNQIDNVDLLYFPTGGGKTEAFLGITVFTLFFDRYRGKKSGVSTIIKYPLRLLSVQQVDRLVNTLAWAEEVRLESLELFEGERFTVGYYVGDNSTPNKIDNDRFREIKSLNQNEINEKYRIIDTCPFCNTQSIDVKFDENEWRLKHVCNNSECISGDSLPIYIVDNEIYRYLPSVVVSTIDKIAFIGLNSNFRNILGEVKVYCPRHGYTSKANCIESYFCKVPQSNYIAVELKDAAPTLIIQDEIHLIRESLGTFDSHYETFIQYYLRNLGRYKKKIKIIGATATIADYKDHIRHLYDKDATRFPAESPFIGEDFYSFVDYGDLHRIIIGFAPYGKAIINSVVYAMKYMREIIWKYYLNPSLITDIPGIDVKTNSEILQIIQDYWVFIEYNNIKRDATDVQNAIDNIINAELKNEGIPKFNFRSMTGDDHFQDVRKTLFDIGKDKEVETSINLINATNMISHGVDTSRFNIIFFFGMPRNTAEYIQAYSRVGRTYTGIVIDIIRPTRDRDLSYLKNFIKFHEYKDILIDPVPINRWANNAIRYTFPGILSGLFINYYDNHLNSKYGNLYDIRILKDLIINKIINKEETIEHIKKAYKCLYDDSIPVDLGKKYSDFINYYVNKFFDEIKSASLNPKSTYITNNINMVVPELERVMNSLRDTEKNVTIELR